MYVSEVTRWAATTQPVSRSKLKYSMVYPIKGLRPVLVLLLHDMVTEVARRSTILGLVGACGKVAGSGVLWKIMFGFLGFSTESEADHDVSPLSELAVQVYNPVSSVFKSEMVMKFQGYCG